MEIVLWSLFSFLIGSFPFAVWIGNIGLQTDIRQQGDLNPGATNVLRTGGLGWFLLALILDISKGALPLGLAVYVSEISGWSLIPIALAPPLGHAFSPFLKFRGGKAIAATFGVWIGLTLWKVPLISMLLLVFFSFIIAPSGWAVVLTLISTITVMALWPGDPILLTIFGLHSLLLIYTHCIELRQKPSWRVGNQTTKN